ncbi:PIG-L deacetylase family protein [Ferrimonas pelagia]|uniref:GlcNAc-PI de-N-acetylase n=1 Tax=Ferrimonas pelagia TaxID=1177826 RepID=A0ABP9EBZ2_9GAMM
MSNTLLLLGVYGMEMVECGGALALNKQQGGQSHAALMLVRDDMKDDIQRAGEVLGIDSITHLDFERGGIDLRHEYKQAICRVIRTVKPDIIITQDPEHSYEDLDPDRRPAMLLLLEAIALAGRDYGLEAMPELAPHPVPTIYYMSPAKANCNVDIAGVLPLKQAAMAELKLQMEFSGQHARTLLDAANQDALMGGSIAGKSDYEVGRAFQGALDYALHVGAGIGHHGRHVLAEPYRKQGLFELKSLMV